MTDEVNLSCASFPPKNPCQARGFWWEISLSGNRLHGDDRGFAEALVHVHEAKDDDEE